MDKYAGKRLDGRYEIQELVGAGGMALVYRAYDTLDQRTVAIKILKDEFLDNAEFIRRFKNESKAIALLSHPNIIKVYDVSFGDQIQYIVEEYIDGITLREYLDRQTVIDLNKVLYFTTQILRALQHAHQKGIVHRDIKPQNIMVLPDDTIKVTDFGIARFARSETRTMTDKAIGSVHYIAPEQARGDLTDEKADIYSVGVMLYEMITGQLPFEAENAVSVAIMQLQAEPQPPMEINPDIPLGLQQITLHAMQKDPTQRYQTATEMLLDLKELRQNPDAVFEYKYIQRNDDYATPNSLKDTTSVTSYDDGYNYVEHPEQNNAKAKKRKKTPFIIGGIALGVVILAVILMVAGVFKSCGTPSEVKLPNFVGQKYEDVVKAYNGQFNFVEETKTDSTKETGTIVSQSPTADMTVKKGSDVHLTVIVAADTVQVPDVTGKTVADAKQALISAGLQVGTVTAKDGKETANTILETSPAAGTSVDKGSKVNLVYSTGKKETKISVTVSLPSVSSNLNLSYYLDGVLQGQVTVNPAYNSTWTQSFSGETGTKILTVSLGGNIYRKISLDFDSGNFSTLAEYPYTEPQTSKPTSSKEPSSSSSNSSSKSSSHSSENPSSSSSVSSR
ncbi:MAG: Stk1 family PASTA domain-containing Ser/Thr kinase [Clostridiales bacterium]|jgi:serine/threonine-protein kinase|nr:Stk1 family PASTA domain-containing Ser/Thr kinase [Clostridiales bacterium]MCI2161787.1 Stk1 family PASTA domain-containing Ser/Thr kinase [Oscillospiraceae bacterium]MCI1960441.1 Stk1 family PASTA domain-containing Ser/Thr kinase [Clostridiales bacterium]MCI2020928.1 Stk1 family PASTA domain-containing Ser/Thr kinase [Clostridiales bacterium]MCI2025311.1 Stk1 family PASTA domain-containing Ser/Thr kinase [Clostridiales bacterium]